MEELKKSLTNEIKNVDEKQGIVQFYANAFNVVDSDGDVSLPGSFSKTLKDNIGRMRWLLNHDTDKLLGVPFIDGGIQDGFGLLATNKANMSKTISKDTFQDYLLYKEYGRTLEHSVRVRPIKFETVANDAIPVEFKSQAMAFGMDQIRIVKEWSMFEVSTVMWGANQHTPMVDIKSLEHLDDTLAFLDRMLKGDYTDERLKKIEETYNILQSLKKEPLKATQVTEPATNTFDLQPIVELIGKSKLFN